ncbi:MAG TPA: hypothetical protein VFD32_15135 [Dehalococcoidia bacterium]|nr:hypothetical protein [Dehalococcoidia bacterium]
MAHLAVWSLRGARTLVLIISALFASGGFLHASSTGLPGSFDPYIHRAGGEAADPINLIFRGADADTAARIAQQLLGWPVVAGSPMDFFDEGHAHPTAWQLGGDLGHGSRYHLRIEATGATDGQSYTLAAVHRDDSVACGHVGRAFDQVRDIVAHAFADAGYRVTMVWLGNTNDGPQCDGSRTAGGGEAAIIDLGSS